jgi:hypothetical protein
MGLNISSRRSEVKVEEGHLGRSHAAGPRVTNHSLSKKVS